MTKSLRFSAFLVVALVAPLLVGCGGAGQGGRIEGIDWTLRSYSSGGRLEAVPSGARVDAKFEAGTVSGFSGVNTYSGMYRLSGDDLDISGVASTMMAGPEDLMDLERAYLSNLEKTVSFRAGTDSLTLLDGDGRELLEYRKGS